MVNKHPLGNKEVSKDNRKMSKEIDKTNLVEICCILKAFVDNTMKVLVLPELCSGKNYFLERVDSCNLKSVIEGGRTRKKAQSSEKCLACKHET